ncbi:hypothetical protein [Tellurirhabdus rosea]|uniref:hypothetical protein n=1 Tax=Tellurirhabdus rosea TaxID=2674997 RepID=UPI002255EA10|nr:hypothetical protein [Tellurirhabdus rosea]
MIAENGQGRAEFYYTLERCCQLVSETYGKPERAEWTNSDYIRLSRILFRKTSVQISPNTLKRIFGKIKTDSRYYPQKATRDALASYIGFPDWEDFAQAHVAPAEYPKTPEAAYRLPAPEVPAEKAATPPAARPKAGIWLAAAAFLLLGAAAWLWPRKQAAVMSGPAQLICENPVGENPHSAKFQLKNLEPSAGGVAYVLDFGDGRRTVIDTTTILYNHYYEKPGRYLAVLRQGTRNLDSAVVYLPTKGWTATSYMMYDTTRVYPIETKDLFVSGKRSISAAEAAHAGIDTNRTFFIEFANTHPTDIDGDNFELTTRVTTSPARSGVRCSQVDVTVYGESSRHSFDVMMPGCVYWTQMQLSERLRSGQKEDLGFLGADLRTGGTLKLRVVNRQASLFINNRKVYTARYDRPLRRIYGVNLRFAGIGTVHAFTLKDLKSGAVFDGSFP